MKISIILLINFERIDLQSGLILLNIFNMHLLPNLGLVFAVSYTLMISCRIHTTITIYLCNNYLLSFEQNRHRRSTTGNIYKFTFMIKFCQYYLHIDRKWETINNYFLIILTCYCVDLYNDIYIKYYYYYYYYQKK